MEWIKVTDRLPENEDVCLIVYRDYDDELNIAFALYSKKLHEWKMGPIILDRIVTHWMPLPQLPEEE